MKHLSDVLKLALVLAFLAYLVHGCGHMVDGLNAADAQVLAQDEVECDRHPERWSCKL